VVSSSKEQLRNHISLGTITLRLQHLMKVVVIL